MSEQEASGTPQEGAESGAGGEGSNRFSIERLRSDPDFAEQYTRGLQSKYDKLQHRVQGIQKTLGPMWDQLESGTFDGNNVWAKSRAWDTAAVNPVMGRILTDFVEQGKVPTLPGERGNGSGADASGGDDQEFWTDTERMLAARADRLENELQQLRGRMGRTESSFGMSSLQGNLVSVADRLGLPDPVFERVKEVVAREVDQLSQRHAQGDAAAEATFMALVGRGGDARIERLVRANLTDEDMDEIVQHRRLRKERDLAGLSTGGPGEGGEPAEPLDPKQKFESWGDAIRAAKRAPGRNVFS